MSPTTDDDATDELRDAAANLRRLANGENLAEVYPEFTPHNVIGALCCDRGTLADAWLADRPADDGVEITREWLTAEGLPPKSAAPVVPLVPELYGCDRGDWRLLCRPRKDGGWRAFVWQHMTSDTQQQSVSVIVATRGQLRRLLAALGVPPAVPTDPTTPEE